VAVQKFLAMDVWKALAEPRSKLFIWLALHDRILIADNTIKKTGLAIPLVPYAFV
jgi:hypothetical protein